MNAHMTFADRVGLWTSFKPFIDWLKGKDPNGRYRYDEGQSCLCAQYFSEKMGEPCHVSTTHVSPAVGGNSVAYPNWMDRVAIGNNSAVRAWTYGEALERAQAYVPVTELTSMPTEPTPDDEQTPEPAKPTEQEPAKPELETV